MGLSMDPQKTGADHPIGLPGWMPLDAVSYVAHTELGLSLRAIARDEGSHASTILRQVRRWENQRDDALIKDALIRLGVWLGRCGDRGEVAGGSRTRAKEYAEMSYPQNETGFTPDDEKFEQDARRVLRRLCEPGAVLAVAAEMDKAVVVRETESGSTSRTAVVERDLAQALALKQWITCSEPGRIARYHITAAGRAALNRMMAEEESAAARGFAEAQAGFEPATGPRGARPGWAKAGEKSENGGPSRSRFGAGDSPLLALSRRRDKDGKPFLSDELVSAGERLREDFELAHMGPRTTQNWEGFLTGPLDGTRGPADSLGGSRAARDRAAAALRALGPGLGDVALRCCCYLEGLEQTEKHMGWSARSGKIVLRIALQRLRAHYDGLGDAGGLIG